MSKILTPSLHEACHAVIARYLGRRIHEISISDGTGLCTIDYGLPIDADCTEPIEGTDNTDLAHRALKIILAPFTLMISDGFDIFLTTAEFEPDFNQAFNVCERLTLTPYKQSRVSVFMASIIATRPLVLMPANRKIMNRLAEELKKTPRLRDSDLDKFFRAS